MAYLRHYWNGNTVTFYEIKETVTIGRQKDCNIPIDDPTVSALHAQLQINDNDCTLTDLNSTNGVRLRGKNIEAATPLKPGDLFSIGTHEFEFLLDIPNDLDRTLKIKKSWIPGVYFTE